MDLVLRFSISQRNDTPNAIGKQIRMIYMYIHRLFYRALLQKRPRRSLPKTNTYDVYVYSFLWMMGYKSVYINVYTYISLCVYIYIYNVHAKNIHMCITYLNICICV